MILARLFVEIRYGKKGYRLFYKGVAKVNKKRTSGK